MFAYLSDRVRSAWIRKRVCGWDAVRWAPSQTWKGRQLGGIHCALASIPGQGLCSGRVPQPRPATEDGCPSPCPRRGRGAGAPSFLWLRLRSDLASVPQPEGRAPGPGIRTNPGPCVQGPCAQLLQLRVSASACVCMRNFCGKAQEARGGTPWGTGGPWWTWYLWEGDFPLDIFFVVLMNYESALAI